MEETPSQLRTPPTIARLTVNLYLPSAYWFRLVKRLQVSWFPRLRFLERCRIILECTITIEIPTSKATALDRSREPITIMLGTAFSRNRSSTTLDLLITLLLSLAAVALVARPATNSLDMSMIFQRWWRQLDSRQRWPLCTRKRAEKERPTKRETYTQTKIQTGSLENRHAYINWHTYIRCHTYRHTYIHTCIHTCLHTHRHKYIHTQIHKVTKQCKHTTKFMGVQSNTRT